MTLCLMVLPVKAAGLTATTSSVNGSKGDSVTITVTLSEKVNVISGAISFEYDVPTVENFRSRIENTLSTYPYLVAVVDGVIAGYAYAGAFKGRRFIPLHAIGRYQCIE